MCVIIILIMLVSYLNKFYESVRVKPSQDYFIVYFKMSCIPKTGDITTL